MSIKTLYNPASLSREELIDSFVVRTKNFEKIFSDIKSCDMRYPEKHYLIQGQRGMGKTTLLLRLKYEIEKSEKLNKWLLPVFFGEESYDLTSLSRLWEKLLDFLDDALETDGQHYEHTEDFIDFEDYEKRCFDYLIEVLRKHSKKIIIFFDNFGQLFLENLKEKEKRRLREILMHCNEIRIIGASAIVLQDIHDYSEPFYEFFQIIRLEGLNKEETFELIERLQEKSTQKIDLKRAKGKIETLAILTGGVIRTLMMVYEVLLEDQDGSALNDLEIILDQVTPLYKHRIEDLPIQQRRIVDVIAKNWDAISTKEIADRIREDGKKSQTKLISAHLAQLEKNNVIEKKQTNTKNHLYQLKERFFNIWYLMRNGDRRDQRKVKWLTKFLEVWYDDEDGINSFLDKHISLIKSGKYNPKSALLVVEALVESEKIDPFKLDLLIAETSGILNEDQRLLLPDMDRRKFALAKRYYDNEELGKGIDILERITNRNHYQKILLSFFYLEKSESEMAIKELDTVSNISNEDLSVVESLIVKLKKPEILEKILENSPNVSEGRAHLTKGIVYNQVGNLKLAELNYLKAINNNEKEVTVRLAKFYADQNKFDEAEYFILKGKEKGDIDLNELVEFYLFFLPQKGKHIRKVKKLLLEFPQDNLDYLFFKAVSLLFELGNNIKDRQGKKEEFKMILEQAFERYNEESIIDFRAHFIASNILETYSHYSIDKSKAIKVLSHVSKWKNLSNEVLLAQCFVLIWNREYEKAIEILRNKTVLDEVLKDTYLCEEFNDSILLLIAKQQYHLVLDLFSSFNELKEVLKPTYYALMTLLKDEYPNEIIKMGEELNQPVNDILERIEEMRTEYK